MKGMKVQASISMMVIFAITGLPKNDGSSHPSARPSRAKGPNRASSMDFPIIQLTATGDTPAVSIPHADLGNPQKGTLTKLENLISRSLPALIAQHEESLAEHQARLAHATDLHGQAFARQDELDTARQRYTTINEQLTHQTPLTNPQDENPPDRFNDWAHATNPALITDPNRDTFNAHLNRLAHLGADLDHLSTRLKGLHPEAIHRALETNLRQRTTAAPTSSTTQHTTQHHPMGHTRSTAPRHTPPR